MSLHKVENSTVPIVTEEFEPVEIDDICWADCPSPQSHPTGISYEHIEGIITMVSLLPGSVKNV